MEQSEATMDLNEMIVFARVVQTGSFSGAGRALDMPKSTVSRKVAELEERLGSRLLQRTTRKMNLTDVGRTYYKHCARILAEIQEAETSVSDMQAKPHGLLRISAPTNFGFLGPITSAYLKEHAEVQVEVVCTDRVVDLIEEGFDAAIRVGRLADSSLISRSLGQARDVLVAGPGYLERRGQPESPEELNAHECLLYGSREPRGVWELRSDAGTRTVSLRSRLVVVNDLDLLHEAALTGLGIALLPAHRCVDDLRSGRLQRILPQWCTPPTPIQAVYPSTRHLSPKLKAFLDTLQAQLTPLPWDVALEC